MELLIDPPGHADSPDAFEVARPRTECQPIEHMNDLLIRGQLLIERTAGAEGGEGARHENGGDRGGTSCAIHREFLFSAKLIH